MKQQDSLLTFLQLQASYNERADDLILLRCVGFVEPYLPKGEAFMEALFDDPVCRNRYCYHGSI